MNCPGRLARALNHFSKMSSLPPAQPASPTPWQSLPDVNHVDGRALNDTTSVDHWNAFNRQPCDVDLIVGRNFWCVVFTTDDPKTLLPAPASRWYERMPCNVAFRHLQEALKRHVSAVTTCFKSFSTRRRLFDFTPIAMASITSGGER